MNNRTLFVFALLLLLGALFIQIYHGKLFTLIERHASHAETHINGAQFPKQLQDASGVTFTIPAPPQRILSATLASDHILTDLVDPKRIVAVSHYVDEASMSNVVDFYDKQISRTSGEIESMLALQPDLVLMASFSNPETLRYLLRSDIPTMRLSQFNSFADIFSNIRLIASATDSQIKAEQLISKIQQRIDFIKHQLKNKKRPRVLYYDLNGFSVGGNSLMDEAITLSGGINVTQGVIANGENRISEELAISLQPDVIIMNAWIFNQQHNQQQASDILVAKSAWQDVPAVKNRRVYAVPGVWLRSISQHRIKGVEAVAKLLHPDIQTYHEAQSQ